MKYLMVKHKVEDFERWHKVFASHAQAQREAGLKDPQVFRSADDPNRVTFLFRVEDVDKMRAFSESGEAAAARKSSGVMGEPEVFLLDKA